MIGAGMEPSTESAASAVSAKPATSVAIGGRGRDTVMQRVTGDGRAVTFLATDLIPGRPLRLWGALAEAGGNAGEGGGVFIRLGILGAMDGWIVSQLLAVALARFEAELARTGAAEVAEIVRDLELAAATYREAQASEPVLPVSFEPAPSASPSPYPWTVARAGLFPIPLSPDAAGRQNGVTPEQLLVVLDLAMSAWLPITPWRRSCWESRRAVRAALAIEARRTMARETKEMAATPGATAPPPGGM
jgi:hypothetical protein